MSTEDDRFRRIFSWALVVIVGVSLLRFAATLIDDTVLDRLEKVYDFVEHKKHDRLMEEIKKAEEIFE